MYNYSLGLYEKAMPNHLSVKDKLLTAQKTGYDFMELCVDLDPAREARLNWNTQKRQELVSFMLDSGTAIKTISLSALRRCPLGTLDAKANEEALDMLRRALQLVCDLGARVLLWNGYDVHSTPSTPETGARFQENLLKAVALAEEYGVIIAMENAEKPFADTISKAVARLSRVQSPYCCIYGDIANTAIHFNGDVDKSIADIQAGRGKLAAMHLKDGTPGEYRFTPYGDGFVDFARSVDAAKSLGVRLFTAELFMRKDVNYIEEATRVSKFLRSQF